MVRFEDRILFALLNNGRSCSGHDAYSMSDYEDNVFRSQGQLSVLQVSRVSVRQCVVSRRRQAAAISEDNSSGVM